MELPEECAFRESHPEYCIYLNEHDDGKGPICCEHCGIPCEGVES